MEVSTLNDIPRRLLAEYRKSDQLLYKEGGGWKAIATQDLWARIVSLTLGLRRLGMARGDRVAILSENRPEWTIADYAILAAGGATVPIYPTLLPDQIEFLLRDSGAAGIIVSSAAHLQTIAAIRPRLPDLRLVVAMESPAPTAAGVTTWTAAMDLGAADAAADPQAFEALAAAARPEDLASIIYTSGTTGVPKGVMLTHANFVHNVKACCAAVPFVPSDLCLSILPLSHVYERLVEYCYLYRGATIAYAESIEAVPRNLAEVRPTIACAVPRLFEKMHRRLLDGADALPAAKRPIFFWAMAVARRCAVVSQSGRSPRGLLLLQQRLADRLVYRAIRERFGGRLRFFVSGSAPLAREIAELFFGVGVIVLEGYGMTESSPVIAVNRLGAICFGTVGRPVDGMEVRIAPDGEILARGASVMQGYYRNEEATRDSLKDGWLHTGDVGHIDDHGCLVITDRKKEVLKTSGGKMIAPQHIENLLAGDRFIAQAMVVGDRRNYIAALIVPNLDQLKGYADYKGIPCPRPEELLRHPRILDLLGRRIARINERLARYERIKKFRVLPSEFRADAGELTPTLKIRRKVIEERYRPLIEEMYAEPAAGDAAG